MDAAARGAHIRLRTEVTSARRAGARWRVTMRDPVSGASETVEARVLVNASGAWMAETMAGRVEAHAAPKVRLVKGSHIVVPRLYEHDRAYIFQNPDRRIVFAIPYEGDFTLIGTTDVDCTGDLDHVGISGEEVDYLCGAVNRYFAATIAPTDVVWSYAGVRSLHDDGRASAQDTTRDFVLELDGGPAEPPLVSIIGGKITTYRRVAEAALRLIVPALPGRAGPAWTRGAILPGGDLGTGGREGLARELAAVPGLSATTAERLARTYGTRARAMLADAAQAQDLGRHFGAGLYEREVRYLIRHEWAGTADDILWRRTKLGLRLTREERAGLEEWLRLHTSVDTSHGAVGPAD
jgi:glycerol-3-phosphate dehydrogenase